MSETGRKANWLRDYESWTFRDRAFLRAFFISVVWHLFWFFAVTITVSPLTVKAKPHPRIVSLGSVMDDSIMRTLIETRPEVSQAYYRPLSELPPPPPPPVKTIERRSPGDIVSVPLGKRFLNSVKMLVGGSKASPDAEFDARLPIGYTEDESPAIEGELSDRAVVYRPDEPQILIETAPNAETEIQFAVNANGSVTAAEVTVSSGNADVDEQWERYLQRWEFEPLGLNKLPSDQHGRVRFRAGRRERG